MRRDEFKIIDEIVKVEKYKLLAGLEVEIEQISPARGFLGYIRKEDVLDKIQQKINTLENENNDEAAGEKTDQKV